MSRGFITLGINTDKDRIKHCYSLALSIKAIDPEAEVCMVVDIDKFDEIKSSYKEAFDYITELPFGLTSHIDGFHAMNLWQMIHATPFDETIYLDADTILRDVDLDLLWDQFADKELAVSTISRTYRNMLTDKSNKFEIEQHYDLPQNYNNMIYFDRGSDTALEWFKMADPVLQNWRDVYSTLFKEKKPQTFDKNLLLNIVTHFLDVQNEIGINMNNLYDIDTRSSRLWNADIPHNWTEMFNSWYTDDNKWLIENYNIPSGIIHYGDEEFITTQVLDVLYSRAVTSIEASQG